MSFYGTQKRVNSSPFIFDKIYPNRKSMQDGCSSDNIYIGRYILVKYTTKFITENDLNSAVTEFNKYIASSYESIELTADTYVGHSYYVLKFDTNTEAMVYILDPSDVFNPNETYYVLHQEINPDYQANAAIDMAEYQDTYDATIWQKIYTGANTEGTPEEKYILIAEGNAAVPRLELDIVSPKYYEAEQSTYVEKWNQPKVLPDASSEDAYTFQMPNVLHLDVGDMGEDFYAKALIEDPSVKVLIKPNGESTHNKEEALTHDKMLSSEHNYMRWTNMYYNNAGVLDTAQERDGQVIDGKKLDTQLYAFGQLISDLYDALYGAPKDGNAGLRPFYTDSLDNVLSNYDKGLVGILSSLATDAKGDGSEDLYSRTLQPGMYYYFITKWNDASEDPDNFIENIPEVIGAKGPGSAYAHYWLDFNKYDQNGTHSGQTGWYADALQKTRWTE